MKKLIACITILSLAATAPQNAKAQSVVQLTEQLGLDYQKLAQLKQMLNDMYTGYKKVYSDYEQVRTIAQGNFNLHKAFLDALLAVSPIVRDYAKVQHIIDNEAALVKEYQSAKGYFTNTGLNALTDLYTPLLSGSLRNLDELTDVLTDNTLRMSDAERLEAIDRIDRDMSRCLSLLREFANTAAIQAGQQSIEQNNIIKMQELYGINH